MARTATRRGDKSDAAWRTWKMYGRADWVTILPTAEGSRPDPLIVVGVYIKSPDFNHVGSVARLGDAGLRPVSGVYPRGAPRRLAQAVRGAINAGRPCVLMGFWVFNARRVGAGLGLGDSRLTRLVRRSAGQAFLDVCKLRRNRDRLARWMDQQEVDAPAKDTAAIRRRDTEHSVHPRLARPPVGPICIREPAVLRELLSSPLRHVEFHLPDNTLLVRNAEELVFAIGLTLGKELPSLNARDKALIRDTMSMCLAARFLPKPSAEATPSEWQRRWIDGLVGPLGKMFVSLGSMDRFPGRESPGIVRFCRQLADHVVLDDLKAGPAQWKNWRRRWKRSGVAYRLCEFAVFAPGHVPDMADHLQRCSIVLCRTPLRTKHLRSKTCSDTCKQKLHEWRRRLASKAPDSASSIQATT